MFICCYDYFVQILIKLILNVSSCSEFVLYESYMHNAIAAVNTAVGRHENVLKWRHQLMNHSPDGRTDHNPND